MPLIDIVWSLTVAIDFSNRLGIIWPMIYYCTSISVVTTSTTEMQIISLHSNEPEKKCSKLLPSSLHNTWILNTKRHYGLNVKILNYCIIYIYLNELIFQKLYNNCVPIWLSDFQRNQSKILIILPLKFSKFNLKKL